MSARDTEQRFWSKVDKSSDCWLWTASVNGSGYGQFAVGSRSDGTKHPARAHVYAYEMLVGPVPAGFELDHLCRVRSCVNPAHLEVVTPAENKRRGVSPPAVNARRTHCTQGHPLDGDNLIVRPDGKRRCRQCANDGQNQRRRAARGK